MSNFISTLGQISDWLWMGPLLVLIAVCGLVYTVRLNFMQIRHLPYILKQTAGSILKPAKGEGTVSPFQAAATALASTVGASNIVGVPIAIAFGGPGAVFWMWVCAVIGMSTKFAEVVLGVKYREKNEDGEYVGGGMYYTPKLMKNKKLAKIIIGVDVALAMLCMPFSIATQSVSAVQSVSALGANETIVGVVLTVFIGIVTFGGVKRIANVVDKLVPAMVGLYLLGALIIIGANITTLPGVLVMIVKDAFTGTAAVGGFAGAGVAAAVRWGFARGTYSTDAGTGTASMSHAAATTDHPVRQGFWGIFEVGLSGLVICTLSGLTVLCSGVWQTTAPEQAGMMPTFAFQSVFGDAIGGTFMAVSMLCFVVSTMIVQVFFGEKEMEYFFGTKFAKKGKIIFVLAVFMGATFSLSAIVGLLDFTLAMVMIPIVLFLIIFNGKVVEAKNEFFTDPRYYKKDIEEYKQAKAEKKAAKAQKVA